MYHTITAVAHGYNPIIVEGDIPTQLIIFNAGPSPIEAQVWRRWIGKENNDYSANLSEPNFRLELRAGDQRIVYGSFIRLSIKREVNKSLNKQDEFAAVGSGVISSPIDRNLIKNFL